MAQRGDRRSQSSRTVSQETALYRGSVASTEDEEHPPSSPRLFLSYSRDNWETEGEALAAALARRGWEVSHSREPAGNVARPELVSQIASADLMVVLVAAGDERSDWMQEDVRHILQTCWRRPEASAAVVAPAVGAIPAGLRHQPFVRYFPHDEVHIDAWPDRVIVDDFAARLIAPTTLEQPISDILDDADLRDWRNRLVHLGSLAAPDEPDKEQLRRKLRAQLRGLRPIVDRAQKEGATLGWDDIRALLDRALLALAIRDQELLAGYSTMALAARRLMPTPSESEASLDYGLGVIAGEVGDLHSARELYKSALHDSERILGPTHPATIAATYNLAKTLAALGDELSARHLYERALQLSADSLGSDHPQTAAVAYDLGIVVAALGDQTYARSLFERAAAAYRRVRPDDSPELQAVLRHLTQLR